MNKIDTKHAPVALGPYSQGVSYQQLLFVSGQLPIDPETGKMIEGEIAELTRQVLKNIEEILKEGDSDLTKVLRVDIFLKDLKNDFSAMNEVYGKIFQGPVFPARQTVQVSELPLGSLIEISCIAYREKM